jgi:NADPH-dependent curcumin reductase CurA
MDMSNPIVIGTVIGAAGNAGYAWYKDQGFVGPKPKYGKITLVGAASGGVGGWIASQIMARPSAVTIAGCAVLGVVVFNHFLRGSE